MRRCSIVSPGSGGRRKSVRWFGPGPEQQKVRHDAIGGGSSACSGGCGVVFKVDTAGKETVLHSLGGGTDGVGPLAGLVRDDEGSLYGTTQYGGAYGQGTGFNRDNTRRETVLYAFTGGADGGQPFLGYLLRDAKGNLYGTTVRGGASSCSSFYAESSSSWTRAARRKPCMASLEERMERIRTRVWWGMPRATFTAPPTKGGASGEGTVFMLDKAGNETVLHTFTGTGGDGAYPFDGLVRDARGNLYGTANSGGANGCFGSGCGIVFMLTPRLMEFHD